MARGKKLKLSNEQMSSERGGPFSPLLVTTSFQTLKSLMFLVYWQTFVTTDINSGSLPKTFYNLFEKQGKRRNANLFLGFGDSFLHHTQVHNRFTPHILRPLIIRWVTDWKDFNTIEPHMLQSLPFPWKIYFFRMIPSHSWHGWVLQHVLYQQHTVCQTASGNHALKINWGMARENTPCAPEPWMTKLVRAAELQLYYRGAVCSTCVGQMLQFTSKSPHNYFLF